MVVSRGGGGGGRGHSMYKGNVDLPQVCVMFSHLLGRARQSSGTGRVGIEEGTCGYLAHGVSTPMLNFRYGT